MPANQEQPREIDLGPNQGKLQPGPLPDGSWPDELEEDVPPDSLEGKPRPDAPAAVKPTLPPWEDPNNPAQQEEQLGDMQREAAAQPETAVEKAAREKMGLPPGFRRAPDGGWINTDPSTGQYTDLKQIPQVGPGEPPWEGPDSPAYGNAPE